jgi:hypothetical protein
MKHTLLKWSRNIAVLVVLFLIGATTALSQTGVTIYERDNFDGESRTIVLPITDLNDITGPCLGNWNNCISSIKVPIGWVVILYEKDGFDGTALPINQDLSDFDGQIIKCGESGDWDNCASSIVVVKI